jgi:hypothetical protein
MIATDIYSSLAPHLCPTEIEAAVLRALKRSRASEVSVSNVSRTVWLNIENAAGLIFVPVDLSSVAALSTKSCPSFTWSFDPEPDQSSRCV